MSKLTKTLGILVAIATSTPNWANPEPPSIDRQMYLAEDRQYLNPTIPTLQTSADGRVGIGHRVEPNSVTGRGQISFRLMVPEKIDRPFVTDERDSRRGSFILSMPNATASTAAGLIPSGPRQEVGGNNFSHAGLCDASGDPNSGVTNPRACGADDCYDLVVVRAERSGNNSHQIFGTPVTVRVERPKTPNARITDVTAGTPVAGSTFSFAQFFEPVITNDGRLMSLRVGQQGSFSWRDNSGNSRSSSSDNVYLVNDNPASQQACDVRQWDQARPLAHAPFDNTINNRYGFAMQPFRDPQNNEISEDQLIGSYPWIDKDGDNITFTTVGTSLFSRRSPFESRCVPGEGCAPNSQSEEVSLINGRVMMGLWTQGKMVLLDGMVNHSDFPLAHNEAAHRLVRLYEDGGSDEEWTRVGDVRSRSFANMPLSNSGNSSFFDSNEHRFNYLRNMKPVTPADVSWLVSTGRNTTEVSFDDYVNVHSFINANMAQTITLNRNGSRGARAGTVQNAATATPDRWAIPAFGTILGDGRFEPVARGGVEGKGYWLSGNNSGLSFDIRTQPQPVLNSPWYYSIFLDKRDNSGVRPLFSFPDGSEIRLSNNELLFVNTANNTVRRVTIPQAFRSSDWAHFGFQLSNRNRTITTYINGYSVDAFDHSSPLFVLSQGALLVGQSQDASIPELRGWIDDVKVFAELVNYELACNHANGTLAGIGSGAPQSWRNIATQLPAGVHSEITRQLNSGNAERTATQYVCYHDYSDDLAANLANIPNGMFSIREDINFPEGPLVSNRPRPDSSSNTFCLGCHTRNGNDGLSLDALTERPGINALMDPRRQPLQPDPLVFGHIPANWLGEGLPERAMIADPREGFRIDQLLLDAISN